MKLASTFGAFFAIDVEISYVGDHCNMVRRNHNRVIRAGHYCGDVRIKPRSNKFGNQAPKASKLVGDVRTLPEWGLRVEVELKELLRTTIGI